jgi:anti-sigma B factor antagonist
MQLEPLTIEEVNSNKNGCRVLRLQGPITISNLFDLQARVRSNSLPALILDLSGVPFVDSAGIGVLMGAYVTHSKDNRSLALVGVCERILNALKITRVDGFFRRFDSLDAAEAGLG